MSENATPTAALPGSLAALHTMISADPDLALAERHRPRLMLCETEPYSPLAFGYTIFREKGQSPSSKFQVRPRPGGISIEYAIWYDWDIQHLYDLEHVWVHLDAEGEIVSVEASRHGRRVVMERENRICEADGGRPVLYAEPGKHAHWASGEEMAECAGRMIAVMCHELAACEGVHTGNAFVEAGLVKPNVRDHRLARLKLTRDAFEPSFVFARSSDEHEVALASWDRLAAWIPQRLENLFASLPRAVPHLRAVLLDCGDTIADEATEEKRPGSEVVLRASLIPGAAAMVRGLAEAGYRLALVADGPRETFENILKPVGLWDVFEAHIISGEIGELKPSTKMFDAAFKALALTDADKPFVAMVGNNLSRDIKGANDFGIQSVFFGWSEQRTHIPADPSETPDHSIFEPSQLLPLLREIEQRLPAGGARS